MPARIVRTALACGAALVVIAATAAGASDVTLPQDLTSGGVKWETFDNHDEVYGCTSQAHAIANGGEYLPAYGPDEARDTTSNDGFDTYALVTVDGSYFLNPGTTVDLTGQTLTTRSVDFGGVGVTVQHTALTGQPILRTFVALHNSTAARITKVVTFEQDLGSDSSTWVQTTSSGDDSWVTADRWAITNQQGTENTDPFVSTVLFGPGTVASPQVNLLMCGDRWSEVASEQFTQSGKTDLTSAAVANANAQTTASYFNVTIPAGETRYLAMFNGVTPTGSVDAALALTPLWNAGLTGPLAEGLTAEQVAATVNWSPEIAAPAPAPEVVLAPRFTG